MPLFSNRDLVPFAPGQNDTDVVVNGLHFNLTTLNYFNYTLYSNGTLSNGSDCWLVFNNYQPLMAMNGTFINGTSCYSPVFGLGDHGKVGVAFATLFATSIMFTLVNLRKHGKRFLPKEKRWRVVGRRWQWYWILYIAACGLISSFMSIDVDRFYVQSTPLILQSFFYCLMLPGLMASVWEGVRHWGSWQERQIFDRDPQAIPAHSTRQSQEFWMPLVFYLFAWLNVFLTIPRSWTPIELQRSPEQQEFTARPTATDARFKAAGILAVAGLIVICYSLEHSIYRYCARPSGGLRYRTFYISAAPTKFKMVITILAVRIGYTIASSFEWSISPFKYDVNSGWIYGLGYAPALLIIIILNIYGYLDPNEDQVLIARRAERDQTLNSELGISRRKPNWWKTSRPDYRPPPTLDENGRLRSLAAEIGGGPPTQRKIENYIQLGTMRTHYLDNCDAGESTGNVVPPANRHSSGTESIMTRSSSDSTSPSAPPQKVKSMLDI
jgi:hypothetical protein